MVAKAKKQFKRVFKSKEDLNLTEGALGRSLFFLSLPVVIINLLRTAYNLVDTFWLGKLSKDALAAITFAYPLVFLFIAFGMGIAVAGSVLVAQNEGANRREEVNYTASQTLSFSMITALILGVGGYFLVEPILKLLGASSQVLPLAAQYLHITTLGLVFLFGFSMFIALMRSYGDTVTPMLIMLGSVTLNIVINPFLIFGWGPFPQLGVAGAAYATVLSRALALFVGLYLLLRGFRGLKIKLKYLKPERDFFKKVVSIGLPASIEGGGRALSVNALMAVVGSFSTAVVAGYGVGVRIFSMVFLPALAVSRSVETMTGQNVGAGRFDRAERANYLAAKVTFGILTAFGVLCFLFAPQIISIFTNEPEVINVGSEFLRFTAFTFGLYGAARVFRGGLRGAGKTKVAAVTLIITLAVIRFPLAYLLSDSLGVKGIWFAFVASNSLSLLIVWAWFRRGTWKKKVIEGFKKGEVAEETEEIEESITESE